MKEKDIITILASARGEVDAPAHKAALRRAVLSQKRAGVFAAPRSLITLISMNKYYISMGSVAAVLAVAVLVAVSPLSTHVASAQEQVQRAYARAIEISPAMRAQIEGQMKADMLKTLAEAKAAPDLKVMTKEEYEKSGQFTFGTQGGPKSITIQSGAIATAATNVQFENAQPVPAGEEGDNVMFTAATASLEPGTVPAGEHGMMAQGSITVSSVGQMATGTLTGVTSASASWSAPVKYLSYTDPQGRKTVLGLDENDTPVFKISTMNADDIKDMGNGTIGIQGKAIQMLQVNPSAQEQK